MILDKIENIEIYNGVSENIRRAIAYIKSTDFSTMQTGKHEIDENMFLLVNEYETKDNELDILEAHKTYIDFQYIMEGSEIIEYELLNEQKIYKDYQTDDDYILFHKTKNVSQLKFSAGMFAILFPDDLHLPGVINASKSNIKKLVLKVLISQA